MMQFVESAIDVVQKDVRDIDAYAVSSTFTLAIIEPDAGESNQLPNDSPDIPKLLLIPLGRDAQVEDARQWCMQAFIKFEHDNSEFQRFI